MFFDLLLVFKNPLILISLMPLVGIFIISLISEHHIETLRRVSLIMACSIFFFSLILWVLFHARTSFFQFSATLLWIPYFNLNYTLGIDGISLFFLLLTTFLINICILISWSSVHFFLKEYLICFFFFRILFNSSFLCARFIMVLHFFRKRFNTHVFNYRHLRV